MTPADLPVLGAGLTLESLEMHRGWVLEQHRDVELQCFFLGDTLDEDWTPLVRRARLLLQGWEGRLGIHGPFLGLKLDSHDRLVRAAVQERLLQALDACEALGATQMVVHSPLSTRDHSEQLVRPQERERQHERVHQTLRPVVSRAEAQGCVLVIENIHDKDPWGRAELARSFCSPAVRVSLDVGHAHYAHVSTGAPPADVFVSAAGDMLAHLHLQDGDGFCDRHWHPGEGTICWHAVFKALGRIPGSPRLIVEVRDHHGLLSGVDHLTRLGLAR